MAGRLKDGFGGRYVVSHFEEVQVFKNLPIDLLTGLVTEKEVSEHREHQGKIGGKPFLQRALTWRRYRALVFKTAMLILRRLDN